MEPKFYKLSGTFSIKGPLFGAALGLVSLFPLSLAYAYLVRYIPFIYLNFMISLGFVALVAYIYFVGENYGKNRNKYTALVGALVMGLVTLYVSWVAFLFVLKHNLNYFELLTNPKMVINIIDNLVTTGWFSIKGGRVSGMLYAIFLGIEALLYITMFIVMWFGSFADNVYCEDCQKWVDRKNLPYFYNPEYANEITTRMLAGDESWIDWLQLVDEPHWLALNVATCKKCKNFHVLNLKEVRMTIVDGENREDENQVLENLIISSQTLEKIHARSNPTPPPFENQD
ncbi:hypothetical protein KKF34_17235 [Myxococcota bacterium]|nr:hypothetical protein [Myxococcota bacterium]MBU1382339.1 hypothetical protein [Myxococcota bacterium]MBU1498625.1 hypothetical protein [Myxococcota bacterium]